MTDYSHYRILYVDDEEKSLKYLRKSLGSKFSFLTSTNTADGYRMLQENEGKVGVIMADQRMPGEKGIPFLEKVKTEQPLVKRILVTAYSDIDTAVDAVNRGAVYKYITKPWDLSELEGILKNGLQSYVVQTSNQRLLLEKIDTVYNRFHEHRLIGLGHFLAGLSHHFKNSLVAIKMFLDLTPAKLKEENIEIKDLRNSDYWVELYNKAVFYVDRINKVIKDVSESSLRSQFAFQGNVCLQGIIRDALARVDRQRRTKDIRIKCHVPDSIPSLTADEVQLTKFFELLLRDELANLPPGSAVTIEACLAMDREINPLVIIRVSDNGPSVAEDLLQTLFDPFQVRNDDPQEFGVNLIICYLIIYQHGGFIEAQNNDDGGLTFTISIPLSSNGLPNLQYDQYLLTRMLTDDRDVGKLQFGNTIL